MTTELAIIPKPLERDELWVDLYTDEPGWQIKAGWDCNPGGYWFVIHDPTNPRASQEGYVTFDADYDDGTPRYPNIGRFIEATKHFVVWENCREEIERLANLPWQANETAVKILGGTELYETITEDEWETELAQRNNELHERLLSYEREVEDLRQELYWARRTACTA